MPHPLRPPSTATPALRALLMALLLGAAATAAAQWAWKDDNGRVVYSDRPPPAGVKSDRIVRQPSNAQVVLPARTAEVPAAAGAASDAKPAGASDAKPADARAAAAPAAPKTTAELEMEFRKRQQERADAEKKAREEESRAATKAADCERARGYLRALEDGLRIERTDASGNREYLDDTQRAAEVERTRKLVQSTCS